MSTAHDGEVPIPWVITPYPDESTVTDAYPPTGICSYRTASPLALAAAYPVTLFDPIAMAPDMVPPDFGRAALAVD